MPEIVCRAPTTRRGSNGTRYKMNRMFASKNDRTCLYIRMYVLVKSIPVSLKDILQCIFKIGNDENNGNHDPLVTTKLYAEVDTLLSLIFIKHIFNFVVVMLYLVFYGGESDSMLTKK